MRITLLTCGYIFIISTLISCSSYSPLLDFSLRPKLPASNRGIKITFLGNTNLLITDGETTLLTDGFFSRPGPLKTLFGKVSPDSAVIQSELKKSGISSPATLDAVLVGHSHHDHAMDSTEIAKITGALVMGNEAYEQIHEANGGRTDSKHLWIVPKHGQQKSFGKFTVTFVPSGHVTPHSFIQEMVEGSIQEPLKMPAHFSKFKCGTTYAIHIAHPDGKMFITTSAGAQTGKTNGLRADVVFLGVGLLGKECQCKQDSYWQENVATLDPKTVVPVHWDDFTRKLSQGLRPPSLLVDNTEKSIKVLKARANGKAIRVMDLRESIYLYQNKLSQ